MLARATGSAFFEMLLCIHTTATLTMLMILFPRMNNFCVYASPLKFLVSEMQSLLNGFAYERNVNLCAGVL
jgi:replicative superfamily II helicase